MSIRLNLGLNLRKVVILLFCIKLLFLDSAFSLAFAQDSFELFSVNSNPVSYSLSNTAKTISTSSLPVTYAINSPNMSIIASSNPVSLFTALSPTTILIKSNSVSYSLSNRANEVKLSSNPVSYLLSSFKGMTITTSTENVSYRIYDGMPLLSNIIPNILPVKNDGTSYEVMLYGENFAKDAVVSLGTVKINTKYISSNELIATIPSSYINRTNSFNTFISNPPPVGSISNGINIKIVDPIPTANITANPSIGVLPQIVTFDGTQSEDLLAKFFGSMTEYFWDFGDKNSSLDNPNTSTEPIASHKYLNAGKYQVKLLVTNSNNKTSTLSKEIEIRDRNDAPTGTVNVNITKADVPATILFTSMITDVENDAISYQWDFGDGTFSKESTTSHIYTEPKTYEPKLIVTDALGAKTILTTSSLKLLPPNNPPHSELTAIPQKSTLQLNEKIQFSSSVYFSSKGTYDIDGENLSYEWDFGDGEKSTEPNINHEYFKSGEYNVKLSITDERNAKVEKNILVSVSKPLPIAIGTLTETTGNAPFTVIFDGRKSSDYDGKPVTLKWDFGDGKSQLVDSINEPINHIYENPGVYLVTLIASTSDNRIKRTSLGNIIVNPNNAPIGQIVKLEGDGKGLLGTAMVKLSCKGSYDPRGDMLSYKWSWSGRTWDGSGNFSDISNVINEELLMSESGSTQEEFNYTFKNIGQFTPVLEISKSDNSKYKYFGETITILEDQAPIAIAKVNHADANIVTGQEILFNGSESYDISGDGIKQFLWDFGDGVMSSEVSPKHIYNTEGLFTPTLTVINNENKIGFAQTYSINVLPDSKIENTSLSRSLKFQVNENTNENVVQDINETIQSMINEQVFSYSSNDNEKPEIGPISLSPRTIYLGDSILLSAFIKDNLSLNTFSYAVYSPSGKLIQEKSIKLSSENEIKTESHILEPINIPDSSEIGTYKIKFIGSDNSGNQIALALDTNKNEEISSTFEVKSKVEDTDTITQNAEKLLLPQSILDVSSEIATLLKERTLSNNYKSYKDINKVKKNIHKKNRLTGLTTKSYQAISNSYIVTNGINNSLALNQLSSSPGSISIGLSGTLTNTNFAKWTYTNVYVDGVIIGSIPARSACKISFDTTVNNPVVNVQFRPLNNYGVELSSQTWTAKDFIFIKNITPPQISSISPSEVTEGRGSFTLNLTGNNFNNSSKIYINGNQVTPQSVNPTSLEAVIPATYTAYSGQSNLFVLNSDGQKSNLKDLIVKPNAVKACNQDKILPKTVYGGESSTLLDGNDVYPQGLYSIINGSGSVSIPFCLDQTLDIKSSIKLSYLPTNTQSGFAYIWLDNSIIGTLNLGTSVMSYEFTDFNTSTLSAGEHKLKVSFSSQGNKLIVENATFKNGSGPVINSISPTSIPQQGITTVTITGKNFDSSTKVYFDGKLQAINSYTSTSISCNLTSNYDSAGIKEIKLEGNGKLASIGISVRDKIELVNNSFMVNPLQPFPGTDFDIEVRVKDSLVDNATYVADFNVLDPDGKLLLIQGLSGFSTAQTVTTKNSAGEVLLMTSVPLNIGAKPGNYKAYVSVKRISSLGLDYLNLESLNYNNRLGLGLSGSDSLVPASCKLSFTPKPSVDFNVGLDENNIENTGFNPTMAIPIQDNQEVKIKLNQSVGAEHVSMLKYNFISSDNRASGLISSDSYTFRYSNKNTLSSTPVVHTTSIEIYWIENGIQTKIRNLAGPNIIVYPNYSPIAKARVLSEQYPIFAMGASLSTAFIDAGSYDPNQNLSKAIDYTDPKENKWELFKILSTNNSTKLYTGSSPVQSDDKKTFYSGNIFDYGSYFAKLTVTDKTGLSDSATTESVTVTGPSQRVGIFASTDPADKKIYESLNTDTIPVMFKSTVFGSYKTINYLWDFGDGTCKLDSDYKECFEANPTHNYFDGKKSFNGAMFTDRRSVTPKVMITANFGNGTSESWEASAGTITFNHNPRLVLLDLKADSNSGLVPFTVNLMIDPATARVVNATPVKYELDWGDGNTDVQTLHATSQQGLTYNDLLSQTFSHTYTTANTYNPILKIYIHESEKIFEFKSGEINANVRGEGGIYLLDDLNTVTITNQPIVTFMVNTIFSNPNDKNNRLRIVIKDKDNAESITELLPNSKNQTVSLSEGKNTYYFEMRDSSSFIQKSELREIILDTVNPTISNIKSILDNAYISISGVVFEDNLDNVQIQIDDKNTIILNSDEVHLSQNEGSEYVFKKSLNGILEGEHNLKITCTDKAGNISEENYNLRKEFDRALISRVTVENGINYISNYLDNLYLKEIFTTTENIVSGSPFALNLNICFSDDNDLGVGAVEANLDISSIKLLEIKQNGITIPTSQEKLNNIYNNLLNQQALGCYNLASIIQLVKPFCSDSAKTICKNTCVHFSGQVCNTPIFSSKILNYSGLGDRFDFLSSSSIESPWNIGSYEFLFQVNENPSSCFTYGTCLGQDYRNMLTSQEYRYIVNIVRNPGTELKINTNIVTKEDTTKVVLENYAINNSINKIDFDLIISDNLPFSENENIIPNLNLENRRWTGLEKINPEITIKSQQIDPLNPYRYLYKLSTIINPTTTGRITLSIPIRLQKDYFNPNGIERVAYIDLPVITNINAEIISPPEGSFVSGKVKITSQVSKSNEIKENLNELQSCKKSEIFYTLKSPNNSSLFNLQKISPTNLEEKITAKGVLQEDGSLKYENIINFNLKNNSLFTKGYLNGEFFGPIDLIGQYSTACNSIPILFNSKPKKYILIDNPKIQKAICKRIKNKDFSQCEITVSNNTLIDDLELEIIPSNGAIDKKTCIWDKIHFENSKKLSKRIKIKCLPNTIDQFTFNLKRSSEFLSKIKDLLKETSLSNTSLEDILIADTVDSIVQGEIIDDDDFSAFQIGDDDEKIATYDNKELSVKQLKELLYTLGYLKIVEDKYTENTRDAFAKFICDIEAGRNALFDPALRFQTAENPLKCTISEFSSYPSTKYIQDVLTWIDFTNGLKSRVGTEIGNYLNPATIGTLAIFLTLSTILPIGTWLAAVGTLGNAVDIQSRIGDANALWTNSSHQFFSQTSSWKAGYSIGIILTAIPILPAKNIASSAKIAIEADKLNDFIEIKNLISNEQKVINQITDATLQSQKQDVLLNFVKLVKEIPDKIGNYELSGKSLLNKTIAELKVLGKENNLIELFVKDTEELGNTQILKNILIDEVQAEAVTRAGKNLSKDLADGIVQVITDSSNNTFLSSTFNGKGYENISKEITRDLLPSTSFSRFIDIESFQKFNLTSEYSDLSPSQLISQINDEVIPVSKVTGKISSGSMAVYITTTGEVANLSGTQINGSQGLGIDYPVERFKGFIEVQIDISKLPADKKIRLPIAVLGNKYFKPSTLNSNSGTTIGGYKEWITDEFPVDITGLITNIKGISK